MSSCRVYDCSCLNCSSLYAVSRLHAKGGGISDNAASPSLLWGYCWRLPNFPGWWQTGKGVKQRGTLQLCLASRRKACLSCRFMTGSDKSSQVLYEQSLGKQPMGSFAASQKACAQCGTTRTPQWREGPAGLSRCSSLVIAEAVKCRYYCRCWS